MFLLFSTSGLSRARQLRALMNNLDRQNTKEALVQYSAPATLREFANLCLYKMGRNSRMYIHPGWRNLFYLPEIFSDFWCASCEDLNALVECSMACLDSSCPVK